MENYSPVQAMKVTRIIHFALVTVPVLFGIVVVFLNLSNTNVPFDGMELFQYIPAIALVLALPVSTSLFRRTIKSGLGEKTDLKSKITAFQTAHLIRMAMFETVGFLAVITCFITGTMYNLAVLLIVILVFLSKVPSVFSLETAVGLSAKEKSNFQS